MEIYRSSVSGLTALHGLPIVQWLWNDGGGFGINSKSCAQLQVDGVGEKRAGYCFRASTNTTAQAQATTAVSLRQRVAWGKVLNAGDDTG